MKKIKITLTTAFPPLPLTCRNHKYTKALYGHWPDTLTHKTETVAGSWQNIWKLYIINLKPFIREKKRRNKIQFIITWVTREMAKEMNSHNILAVGGYMELCSGIKVRICSRNRGGHSLIFQSSRKEVRTLALKSMHFMIRRRTSGPLNDIEFCGIQCLFYCKILFQR